MFGKFLGVVAGVAAVSGGRSFLWTDEADRRHASWHVWVLVWLLPAVFGAGTLFLSADALIKTRFTVPATGEVVRVYDWDGYYSPVFSYVWTDGRLTEASTGISDRAWNFAVGSKHPIRYFSASQQDVVLEGPHNWFVALVIAAITLGLLPLALFGHWLVRRWLNGAGLGRVS
jgi:hypothetical protein